MFNLLNVLFAFIIVGILLLIAKFIKQKIKLFQDLYIPESIIAGTLALLLGKEALGSIVTSFGVLPDFSLSWGFISGNR